MTYGALVVYECTKRYGMTRSDKENNCRIMSLNFKPNTPSGVRKIMDLLMEKEMEERTSAFPDERVHKIVILNMIPLERDKKVPDNFEYEME